MSNDGNSAEISPRNTAEKSDAWRVSMSRWMAELEASLENSRKALLAMDLSGIEGRTQEQEVLLQRFDEQIRQGPQLMGHRRTSTGDGRPLMLLFPLEEEIQPQAIKIQNAVRLQSALLNRAQKKLRLLSRLVAGLSFTYEPFAAPAALGDQGRITNFGSDIRQRACAGGLTGERI